MVDYQRLYEEQAMKLKTAEDRATEAERKFEELEQLVRPLLATITSMGDPLKRITDIMRELQELNGNKPTSHFEKKVREIQSRP